MLFCPPLVVLAVVVVLFVPCVRLYYRAESTCIVWIVCGGALTRKCVFPSLLKGDEERRLGLELGALNDRSNVVVPKSQVGFISFITMPLWRAWSDLVSPDTDTEQLQNLKTNLMFWQSRVAGLEGAAPPVAVTSPSGHTEAANGDDSLTPVRVSITLYDSQDEGSSAPQSESTSPMESPLPSLRQHRAESLQSLQHKPTSVDAAAKPSNLRCRMQRTQSLDSAAQFNQPSSRRRLPLASTMKTTEV
eukprot:m.208236 g.208236  ORF g.208236 m.208236 type:complete len:247 (-) comp18528_c0_seq7:269-1009(-)